MRRSLVSRSTEPSNYVISTNATSNGRSGVYRKQADQCCCRRGPDNVGPHKSVFRSRSSQVGRHNPVVRSRSLDIGYHKSVLRTQQSVVRSRSLISRGPYNSGSGDLQVVCIIGYNWRVLPGAVSALTDVCVMRWLVMRLPRGAPSKRAFRACPVLTFVALWCPPSLRIGEAWPHLTQT